MGLPKMRTAAGVLAEIKAIDPNTEVTLTMVRRIIKSGKVPVVNAGTKKLVNVDAVVEYLEAGDRYTGAVNNVRKLPVNL